MPTSRNLAIILSAFLLVLGIANAVLAQERKSQTVMIDFPIGDVEIRHLESSRGMILDVRSGPISMEARRLFFGDGEHAVKYEGSQFGLQTPTGVVNVGRVWIKNGQKVKTTAANLKDWGAKSGEVYILVPNLKFDTTAKPDNTNVNQSR